MEEDDEARRQREINMFAKLASGDTFNADTMNMEPKTEVEDNDDGGTNSSKDMFAAAAAAGVGENSGTFAVSSAPNVHKAVASSNLDAAVAALTGQEDVSEPTPVERMPLRTRPCRVPLEPTPMYNERVMLPRPLFYGPLLPPRVIKEAREAVAKAMDELNLDPNEQPRLSSLPPHVRNVVGAIKTFGFGLSVFPSKDSEEEKEPYRGSEYVSTYQPVWGDVAREERQALRKAYREKFGGGLEEPSPAGEGTQEQDTPVTDVGQSTSGEDAGAASPNKSVKDVDQDMFLQWARGDDDSDSGDIATTLSFPGNKSPGRSLNKSILARAKSAPAAPAQMVDKDLFAQWARGKPVTPPRDKPKDAPRKRTGTAPDERDLVSRWAQGSGNHSSSVTPRGPADKKVEVAAPGAVGPDVTMFSQWARGEDSDSPTEAIEKLSPRDGEKSSPTPIPDKAMFSQWAQGGSPSSTPPPSELESESEPGASSDGNQFSKDDSAKYARGASDLSPGSSSESSINEKEVTSRADQDRFTKWAQADQDGELSDNGVKSGGGMPYDTFRSVPKVIEDDSDDDSVDRSELKKQVGLNDNLDAALQSFANADTSTAGGRPITSGTESISGEEANRLLSQIGATTPGGRPLSNLEVTNGCVPLFGCDDSPLPNEGDLGIFQTKEDQQRSMEQRRSQEVIEDHTSPNIYGPISCPNPALGPDDNHSWNSRTVPASKHVVPQGPHGRQHSGGGMVPVLNSPPSSRKKNAAKMPPSAGGASTVSSDQKGRLEPETPSSRSASSRSQKPASNGFWEAQGGTKRFDANMRFGWWNVVDDDDQPAEDDDESESKESPPLQLPPSEHAASVLQVETRLKPTPEKLRDENLPLSNLHTSTSIARTLPFLSDRPPSFRYLQIDTEAVGFPSLGGEIEPLFCTLAIYHVETSNSQDPRAAPVPNMQRCGRVTEVLNFDIVRDPEVEARCFNALWPYASSFDGTTPSTPSGSPNQATQGSRCGVFPLPSNLLIDNLYAILIVHKVLSENVDVEAYTNTSKSASTGTPRPGIDIEKLRYKAEKASSRHGSFLMPFAFGVAPLLQIFGTDVPTVVSSRAVQIPLFGFVSGQGDRPIIDHIMVMLYPRADHQSAGISGPAPLTNGGTAMLVMRNFGYLGLHSAVSSKSTLARDRLVDFSGELQVRKEGPTEDDNQDAMSHFICDAPAYVVPRWHKQFVSEPAIDGGRNTVDTKQSSNGVNHGLDPLSGGEEQSGRGIGQTEISKSKFYAQELAPVPLQLMPSTGKSLAIPPRIRLQRSGRSQTRQADVEPAFYTTFCNELLCHPRLLHNTPKGNIAIKVELREVEWSAGHQAYLAHVPKCGPSMHNPRRGPFLVQEAFTACSFQALNAHFLEEFKIKLPLLLAMKSVGGGVKSGPLSLFFSVCNVDYKSKRRWKDRGEHRRNSSKGSRSTPRKGSLGTGSFDEGTDQESFNKKSRVEILACGFLPITTSDTSCLIDNGLHDVKLMYTAEVQQEKGRRTGTLILNQIAERDNGTPSRRSESARAETAEADSSSYVGEKNGLDGDGSFFGSESASETFTESDLPKSETSSSRARTKLQTKQIRMTLQVRIVVHSSVHPQNATLNEFLRRLPDAPAPLSLTATAPTSPWKLSRPTLLKHITSSEIRTEGDHLTDETQKLLLFTIDVSKSSLCSAAEASAHFIRIFTQLMRTLVSGSGTPSLVWANPASAVPLRLHAFATLLQIISSVNAHMVKKGATQLDGKSKWNLTSLGRVMAMVFDEERIFSSDVTGEGMEEVIDIADWQAKRTKPAESANLDRASPPNRTERNRRRQQLRSRSSGLPTAVKNDEDRTSSTKESLDQFLSGFAGIVDNVDSGNDSLQESSMSPLLSRDKSLSARPTAVQRTASDQGAPSSGTTMAKNSEPKIDSKSDFQSALWAGTAESPSSESSVSGIAAAQNMIQVYGNIGPSNRRKWMTAPSSALATIREDADPVDSDVPGTGLGHFITPTSPAHTAISEADSKKSDAVDMELVRDSTVSTASRKMRIPRTSNTIGATSRVKDDAGSDSDSISSSKVPLTDAAIESAGTAFLDTIGKNLGISPALASKSMGGEEQRVGHAHHRKTLSRCSIDWSLPEVDLLMGTHSPLQQSISVLAEEDKFANPTAVQGAVVETGSEDSTAVDSLAMSSLAEEEKNTLRLPNYLDRLVALGEHDGSGRWFPYAYEVIIVQWVALLVDQRRSGEKSTTGSEPSTLSQNTPTEYPPGNFADASGTDAALRARGVAIACAPVLLAIIKKSIGWRVGHLFGQTKKKEKTQAMRFPPLVSLDDVLLEHLEQLVSIITDACIDSRNFDSWEFRQTSIDVNDAIIRFLRDMFAFLDTRSVHRLILVYFSRFVIRDGKHWQDRDSKIGLRCSWEISKLRLNAVTALVRFPDFLRVNSPQMQNWSSWSMSAPPHMARDFFSASLQQLQSLALSGFAATEGPVQKTSLQFPTLKPHWLAELVTDICLSGTEHAEQYIQHRAASLLYELFWSHSQEARASGNSAMVASMYLPFLVKVLEYTNYLSSLSAKNQLRKDILPCVVFVMQCAPVGIMRALWRKLCIQAEGKGGLEKFGGVGEANSSGLREEAIAGDLTFKTPGEGEEKADPDIYDMFGLLNLVLSTFEFEGSDEELEAENVVDSADQLAVWKKEFLLAIESYEANNSSNGQKWTLYGYDREKADNRNNKPYSTSSSRKWHSHDGAIVVIHTCRLIVREMLSMLRPGTVGNAGDNQTIEHLQTKDQNESFPGAENRKAERPKHQLDFSYVDIVIFVRGVTSVYLHALSLKQSDIVIVKTLDAAVEVVKIYGIKVFLHAVGETLQHWMRVISLHCGARRAEVRVQALEFLALTLRLTYDSYGSLLRIRVPLLSVQTEVMERIVATATTRNYREQRRMGAPTQSLSNDSAEASLSPLWRTLDRLHHQSASQNLAFRSALIRLAESMKKLYRAYIAAHALAIVNRALSPLSPSSSLHLAEGSSRDESSAYLQSRRIIVHRIVAASAGYSKQFLGLHRSSSQDATVAHNEAVEDAFLDAAYVFSPTELPSNRVAWLRKLAEFHHSRKKYAEEATCRFYIHITLRQAARLHHWLWANIPFVAWTVNTTDGVHLDGEGPAGEPEAYYDADFDLEDLTVEDPTLLEHSFGKEIDKRNSFRRIFYRVANSVRMHTGDPEIGGKRNLFYGVTFASEYRPLTPWFSLRSMEEELVEEAESAGDLFLQAGIAESSRYCWSLATQIYAEMFNYGKLAHAYRRLANVVSSNVPVVDTSNQALELSHPLGRFYRVWFHGGAPDEINGTEFVYRAAGSVKLEQFGQQLSEVIRGILPENTPIDLVLDDGRPERHGFKPNQRRPLGPPIEPVKIKVTPLRPLLKRANKIRGTPEWFFTYTDLAFGRIGSSSSRHTQGISRPSGESEVSSRYNVPTHHARSSSASVFASNGSLSSATSHMAEKSASTRFRLGEDLQEEVASSEGRGELVGVDKFSFLQPVRKDRNRSTRDWLKAAGDIADKSLRVTQLQVEQAFPACVTRQTVMHRIVFTQSPLEAGVDAVCSWCSVLFRTAVATNGMAVLDASKPGTQVDHGIGTAAAKVVADCIHSSRVKEMGLVLLKKDGYVAEEDDGGYGTMMMDYARMSEDEVNALQIKLARAIVVFMEILHLLIARNRNLLLEVMEARKRGENGSFTSSFRHRRATSRGPSTVGTPENSGHPPYHRGLSSNVSGITSYAETENSHRFGEEGSVAPSISSTRGYERTDKAIAVQSELQRAFINMAKTLYSNLTNVLGSETPRWLKEICRENYFSSSTYRNTKIRMADEICFYTAPSAGSSNGSDDYASLPFQVMSIDNNSGNIDFHSESPNGSQSGISRGTNSRTPIRTTSRQSEVSGLSVDGSSIFHV